MKITVRTQCFNGFNNQNWTQVNNDEPFTFEAIKKQIEPLDRIVKTISVDGRGFKEYRIRVNFKMETTLNSKTYSGSANTAEIICRNHSLDDIASITIIFKQ